VAAELQVASQGLQVTREKSQRVRTRLLFSLSSSSRGLTRVGVQELEALKQAVTEERTIRESIVAETAQLQAQQQVRSSLCLHLSLSLACSLSVASVSHWVAVAGFGECCRQ
jgi:hypothetical protein